MRSPCDVGPPPAGATRLALLLCFPADAPPWGGAELVARRRPRGPPRRRAVVNSCEMRADFDRRSVPPPPAATTASPRLLLLGGGDARDAQLCTQYM